MGSVHKLNPNGGVIVQARMNRKNRPKSELSGNGLVTLKKLPVRIRMRGVGGGLGEKNQRLANYTHFLILILLTIHLHDITKKWSGSISVTRPMNQPKTAEKANGPPSFGLNGCVYAHSTYLGRINQYIPTATMIRKALIYLFLGNPLAKAKVPGRMYKYIVKGFIYSFLV